MPRKYQPSEEQRKAYNQVRIARGKGLLPPPEACNRCGVHPGYASDGRTLLQVHHHDYSRPLDIEWICQKCHRKETRQPMGEENGKSVLKTNLVKAARLLNKEGFAIVDIAEFMNVHPRTLTSAVQGDRWGHVDETS